MKTLALFLGLAVCAYADKYLQVTEVQYSEALMVDPQDIDFDAENGAQYLEADSKLVVRRIEAVSPRQETVWVPLGEFGRGSVHELHVGTLSGDAYSSAKIEFTRDLSQGAPLVFKYDKAANFAKIDFFYYNIQQKLFGIVMRYENPSGSPHDLIMTHQVDRLDRWFEPDQGRVDAFFSVADKESLRLLPPNQGSGDFSYQFGSRNTATGNHSLAFGIASHATADYSIALGRAIKAEGYASFATGNSSEAHGQSSFAAGDLSKAFGNGAVAMGWGSMADGWGSVAMGTGAVTEGNGSVAMGWGARALSSHAFAMGHQSRATAGNAIAMGNQAKSHGIDSVAIGDRSEATQESSIALGEVSRSYAAGATSIGWGNIVGESGEYGVAMGYSNNVTHRASVAMGWGNKAEGAHSTTFGVHNTSNGRGQFIVGEYNNPPAEVINENRATPEDYMLIVGNGFHNGDRSNALTIQRNGTSTFDGQIVAKQDIVLGGNLVSEEGVSLLTFNEEKLIRRQTN